MDSVIERMKKVSLPPIVIYNLQVYYLHVGLFKAALLQSHCSSG